MSDLPSLREANLSLCSSGTKICHFATSLGLGASVAQPLQRCVLPHQTVIGVVIYRSVQINDLGLRRIGSEQRMGGGRVHRSALKPRKTLTSDVTTTQLNGRGRRP